jgi:hypothetical protein
MQIAHRALHFPLAETSSRYMAAGKRVNHFVSRELTAGKSGTPSRNPV